MPLKLRQKLFEELAGGSWYNAHMADVVEKKIDALANAVAQGFKEVGERFDRVEGRLTTLEDKVDMVRTDIAELRFDYKKMLTRIENLELKTFGSVRE